MEAMVYKDRHLAINFLMIKTTKWRTKKTVVENTSHRPEIIGREARKFYGRSIGDPFCGLNQ